METAPNSLIIRTSWLYSSFGNNFVKTMLRLGAERNSLNVIFDQVGTPTYAADLAEAILTIIDQEEWDSGIYHFSNEGVCSWYEFCKVILQLSGNTTCQVSPIESSAYPVRTPRPHYSVLNKGKIKNTFNIEIPYWINALERCINILKQNT
jgi:dTDP-4-dehydrorhamnose reductase